MVLFNMQTGKSLVSRVDPRLAKVQENFRKQANLCVPAQIFDDLHLASKLPYSAHFTPLAAKQIENDSLQLGPFKEPNHPATENACFHKLTLRRVYFAVSFRYCINNTTPRNMCNSYPPDEHF